MKKHKITFLVSLFCLSLITNFSCENGFDDGFQKGREKGIQQGILEGKISGHIEGKMEGLKEGEHTGMKDVEQGRAIQLYYPFMLYSFLAACMFGIILQLGLKYHLKKKKTIKDVHRLFIPGIQYTRTYRFLEEFYDTYYNSLLNDLMKVVFKLVSSKMDVEEKRIELQDRQVLFKEKIESKEKIHDLLNDKLMEEASKEFDRIAEDIDNNDDEKENDYEHI